MSIKVHVVVRMCLDGSRIVIYSYELYKLTGCVIPGAPFNGAAVGLAGERNEEKVVVAL